MHSPLPNDGVAITAIYGRESGYGAAGTETEQLSFLELGEIYRQQCRRHERAVA
jgi:hypothetical protein